MKMENETNEPDTLQTPPATEPPSEPAVDLDNIRSIYNTALQEASQRASLAESELQRLRESQAAPPAPPNPEQDRQNFFDNPRQLIREEMTQIVRPLNEFQQRFTRQESYNAFLQKAANHPNFKYVQNPLVMQGISAMAGNMQTITDDAMSAAYNIVVGHLFSTGQLNPNPVPSPVPNSNPEIVQSPPSPSRPATPLPPVNNNVPKAIQLSEHEKQLARFNNMSDQEYYDFLHMDKSDVVKSVEVKNG